jgi:hypothetical protein
MTLEQSFNKCLENKKRDKRLEKMIIKNHGFLPSYWAYYYARFVIKGRWKEAEPIIAAKSQYAYLYSKFIIKEKLPEYMHNVMLIHADDWSKRYLDFIK